MKKIFISLLILIMTISLFAISYADVPTVNQENRIKLMLAIARERIKDDEKAEL